jgi:N utilization substance protein B
MTDKSIAAVLRALEAGTEPGAEAAAGQEPPPAAPLRSPERRGRSVARLAAVQALYQMELASTGVEAVIREFDQHRFGRDAEGERAPLADADEGFFAELVRGVVGDQAAIDAAIARRLAQGWRLDRLDATVRAILRAGGFELLRRPTSPSRSSSTSTSSSPSPSSKGPSPVS